MMNHTIPQNKVPPSDTSHTTECIFKASQLEICPKNTMHITNHFTEKQKEHRSEVPYMASFNTVRTLF